MSDTTEGKTNRGEMTALARRIADEVSGVFLGQGEILEAVLACMLAGGHVLVEGVPGLGKTLLVRALAKAVGGDSKRVQFTPDLMPSDITGHLMWDGKDGRFLTRKGPVFSNFLIADEINRAPAKTQSALFEAMQEHQVSIDGETHPLPSPFLVLATQNPFEHEGTYPLPDAQKDRFLMKLLIDYPGFEDEAAMVRAVTDGMAGDALNVDAVKAVADPESLRGAVEAAAAIRVDDEVLEYAVRIAAATRSHHAAASGAGPRAGIALVRCARAKALLEDRDFVVPDDVKALAMPVLRHRIALAPMSEIEGVTPDTVLADILGTVEAPRK